MEDSLILQYTKRDKEKLKIINSFIEANKDNKEIKESKVVGNFYPYVTIHDKFDPDPESLNIGMLIRFEDILSFELSTKSFLPTLNLKFIDSSGFFSSITFTTENSIVNLYIKPNNDELLKPIHLNMDILIIKPTGYVGNEMTYYLQCQLRIPNLYTEYCESLFELSSYDALLEIADKLYLGFSSNEKDTTDVMTWINPYQTTHEFIEDITLHSYKDVNSYFTSFIDVYYNLNFVNINKCFTNENTSYGEIYTNLASNIRSVEDKKFEKIPLFLTNRQEFDSLDRFVRSYKLINNNTRNVLQNGFTRRLQFYNQIDDNYLADDSMNIVPINQTLDIKDLTWAGINADYVKEYIKYKYLGKQNENVHDFYMFSKVWNYQNLTDITKNILILDLKGIDMSFYRYQTVPVLIYEYNTLINAAYSIKDKSEEKSVRLNEFLSGKYIILHIDWIYNYPENFFQRLYLIKTNFKK